MTTQTKNSVETILNFETNEDNLSDWSVVWSTNHIPGMDTATGGGSTRRRKTGRRRLRRTALTLGSMLAMHCRLSAASLACGMFVFLMMLLPCIGILGNPLRHFEVYLGQWSLSGPGRAFRIIPMLDGVGIAICIHTIMRAVVCVTMAGLCAIYVMHSASDDALPFLTCRNFDLEKYTPQYVAVSELSLEGEDSLESMVIMDDNISTVTVPTHNSTWRKAYDSNYIYSNNKGAIGYRYSNFTRRSTPKRKIHICKETYDGYPVIYRTTPYNFFYVEVIHYRKDHDFNFFNIPLLITIACGWIAVWMVIISEKFSYGRLVWNNMYTWFGFLPWVWAALLMFVGTKNFLSRTKSLRNVFQYGGDKEILHAITEAFILGAYIHASGLGTEIIHGKGLNFYASGHIDPQLNSDNTWHSALLFVLVSLCAGGTSMCALTDYMQMKGINRVDESTLWILPMYSKCASAGDYAHLLSTLIFSGLVFSYLTVAFVCLKTALHIIFEYRVKLVFVEQFVVGALILACMGLSVLFTTNAGLGLLESTDSIITGVVAMFICAFEMFGIMYVYRSHDFVSDLNIATEENACSTRLAIQWQIIPFVCMLVLLIKSVQLASCEIPGKYFWYITPVLLCTTLSLPLRAIHNAYVFLRPPARHA